MPHFMIELQQHPDPVALRRFVQGRMEELESLAIEHHLPNCRACCERLKDLAGGDDPFVEALRDTVEEEIVSGAGRMPSALPDKIGRFQVREVLGEGSFGIVLAARDERLQRDVAIKIPRPGILLTHELRERFLREATAAAGLDHPNIVPVYEAGEENGTWYIVSACCRGPTLAAWLRQRSEAAPFQLAAWVLAELAGAVHHAHVRCVLHRDLKPSNVLLEPSASNGEANETAAESPPLSAGFPFVPRVADFGLARHQTHGAEATRSDVVMGTAAYMSPEQAAGQASRIGPWSDVYSLGAILYELLTGRPPLVGENELETLQRVQHEEPIAPTRLRPRSPRDLETICLKCLQKEPQRRYASAQQLADDLHRFLDKRPILARPVNRLQSFARWCRRNPAVAALAGCLAAALVLVAIVSGAMSLRLNREIQRTRAAERESKEHLWTSYLTSIAAGRRSGIAGQRFGSLQLIEQAAELARELELGQPATLRLRDEVAACLALNDLQIQQTFPAPATRLDPHRVAFDGSLSQVALIEPGGAIGIRALAGHGTKLRLVPPRGATERIAMSPSGNCVAAIIRDADGMHVALWTLASAQPQPLLLEIEEPACLAFDPEGDTLCVVTERGVVHLYEVSTNQLSTCCQVEPAPRGCSFDESGKRLAVWGGSQVAVIDPPKGEIMRCVAHRGRDQVQAAAFSPDGDWLVTGSSHHLVYVWDDQGSEPVHVLKGHEGWVTAIAFPPSGNFVATSSSDGTTRLWEHWTARELVVASGYGVRFDREGRHLGGLAHSALALYEVAMSNRQTCRAGTQPYESLGSDISPDSRFVASWSDDGVRLWDCSSACELGRIDCGPVYWARWRRTSGGLQLLTGSNRGVSATNVHWQASTRRIDVGPQIPVALPPEIDCPQYPALSRNGQTLAVATGHGLVGMLELEGQHEPVLIHDSGSNNVALCASGDFVVTYTAGAKGMALWEARTGRRLGEMLNDERVLAAGFSPLSETLVVDNGREVIALDTQTWRERQRLQLAHSSGSPNWQSELSFAADCNLLAISRAGYHIVLLEPDCQRVLATLPAELPYAPVCLSSDGSRLACSGSNAVLQLWNLASVQRKAGALGIAW